MGRKGQHFRLLVWKNFLIQKRKIVATIFEIGIPTFFSLVLIFVRLRVTGEMKENKEWAECLRWDKLDVDVLPSRLAFAPNNYAIRRVMSTVTGDPKNQFKEFKGFGTEAEVVDFLMFANSTVNNTRDYLGGVIFTNDFFDGGEYFSDQIAYKIRLSSSPRNQDEKKTKSLFSKGSTWDTGSMFPMFQRVGPRELEYPCGGDPGYVREGFLAVQHAVNLALMSEFSGMNQTDIAAKMGMSLKRHPYPAFDDDDFILVIQNQLPLILMLSFVLIAFNIVKDIVHEKERKLKESMKMMGLNNWLHWLAWFIKYFLFNLVTVCIMSLFLCVHTTKGPVIGNTDPSLVVVFLLLYSVTSISFCFAVSAFFSRANSGAAAGGILFFVTYIPYFFLRPRYQTVAWGQKILTCLMSNVAMAYGGQIIGMFEGTGAGMQWSNVASRVSVDDNFTMLEVMIMLVVDAILYWLIAVYVEAVFPGEYGLPQKWYFPLQRSYWVGDFAEQFVPDDKSISVGQNPELFEQDPVGMRAGIGIRNLRKEFKTGSGKKVAVQGMTLDMYEGQITALLGHNGAGKTTTMSMLTGFIPPSEGTAFVNGFDIRQDIASVRSSLGLCPQHDILFDTLTVEEHLVFFAKLKGCGSDELQAAVDEMLTAIDLCSKRHAQSQSLSGGMRRRLSLGIALIGGSKVVILDEPSSGLDPNARRQIWSILQKNRAGRTMILTTHFMDEADLLGDRIAIMADGVVKCCGSSLFLKNRYGAGYHLTIVKQPSCNVAMTTDLIQMYVPEARLESNVGAELSYVLPQDRAPVFEGLFMELERRREQLGTHSFGVSVTTMEEVFLRVGEASTIDRDSDGQLAAGRYSINNDNTPMQTKDDDPLLSLDHAAEFDLNRRLLGKNTFNETLPCHTGMALNLEQLYAIFVKKALHTLRNKIITGVQLAVPLFFTVAALTILKTYPGPHDSKPLNLTMKALGENIVAFSVKPNYSTAASDLLMFYGSLFEADDMTKSIFVNNEAGFTTDPDIEKYLLKIGHDDVGEYNLKYLIGADISPRKPRDHILQTQDSTLHWPSYDPKSKRNSNAHLGTPDSTQYMRNIDPTSKEQSFNVHLQTPDSTQHMPNIGPTSKQQRFNVAALMLDQQWSDPDFYLHTTAYFNNQAYHTPAITVSMLANALLQYFANNSALSLQVTNHPLPRTSRDKLQDELASARTGFTVAFNIAFGMSFLASSFTLFLIKERAVKAKHLQFSSGVSRFTYWPATFCWDLMNYCMPVVCLLLTLWAFDIRPYVIEDHLGHVSLLFVMYGLAVLPLMYLWSFLFTVPSSGYVWITIFNILSGVATLLAVAIMSIPELRLQAVSEALEWVFLLLLPNFCLAQGLADYYTNFLVQPLYQQFCVKDEFEKLCGIIKDNPCCGDTKYGCGDMGCLYYNPYPIGWAPNGIGRMLVFLGLQFVLYSCILLALESELAHTLLQYMRKSSERIHAFTTQDSEEEKILEDDDVYHERIRLASQKSHERYTKDRLAIYELSKNYGSNMAVKRLSVGIPAGECFGLLGINGAGKTTTFKMLTGDETVSEGTAYINGHSITNAIKEVRENLGYCPQFDALIDQMTGRETLYMYARLRGIHRDNMAEVVDDLLDALLITEHADKLVQSYSGGNKRKLSTAIALVGNPPVVFLDEPTTGMDPLARRFLWDTLSSIRASGRTLILTSHSMEECEALCTRLAIMVNGQFKCLGSVQHLKNKFGEGYTLVAQVGATQEGAVPDPGPLKQFIESHFPGCVLKDVHQGRVHYHITDTSLKWAEIFGIMERAKTDFNIEDYSVSQTTLEQVFINFARAQIPPKELSRGSCKGLCLSCTCSCRSPQDMGEPEEESNDCI